MKVTTIEREVNFLGDFQTKNFFIEEKNVVHIVNILRNKLYTNKVLAVIREYITNAIDATVENNSEKPIEISLPSELNHYFKVRDFGKGLSQEDIEKIFISYGSSTKRNSDEFTGCIGIGSKAAFSYSESFLINSYFEGNLYTYAAYLDETGLGSITLFTCVPTEQESGLEICVPVKEQDFRSYLNEFKNYSLAINFPYELIGGTKDIDSLNIFHKNTGIIQTNDSFALNFPEVFLMRNPTSGSDIRVVMGNVAYKIPTDWFESNISTITSNNSLRIFFKTKIGEIEFSSNREQIELTENNSKILKGYIDRFKEFYINSIKQDFENNSNFLNCYSDFRLKFNLTGYLLDKTNCRKFNLETLEYVLDMNGLLDLTKDLRVFGLRSSGSKYSFKFLFSNKEEFQDKVNNQNYNQRNFPVLVLGSDDKNSDIKLLYKWKNTLREYIDLTHSLNKFKSKFPGVNFKIHDSNVRIPNLYLVYPNDSLTRDEYRVQLEKFGFGVIKIEDLKEYESDRIHSVQYSCSTILLHPNITSTRALEIEIETLEDLESYLLQVTEEHKNIKIINCNSYKGELTDNLELTLKDYSGSKEKIRIYNRFDFKSYNSFLKICSYTLNFVPVFIKAPHLNIKNSKYESLNLKEFSELFLNSIQNHYNNLTEKEKYYYNNTTSRSRFHIAWHLPEEFLLRKFNITDFDAFKRNIKWITQFIKNFPRISERILYPNSKVENHLKKLEQLDQYFSYNDFNQWVSSSKRDFLINLRYVFNCFEFESRYRLQKSFEISKSRCAYFEKILTKIIGRNPFLLFQLQVFSDSVFSGDTPYFDGEKEKILNTIIDIFESIKNEKCK